MSPTTSTLTWGLVLTWLLHSTSVNLALNCPNQIASESYRRDSNRYRSLVVISPPKHGNWCS